MIKKNRTLDLYALDQMYIRSAYTLDILTYMQLFYRKNENKAYR